MSSYNSENTSSCVGQEKRNVQEVRRYDTNMRHNRSSTEGSVGGGGGVVVVKPFFFFFVFLVFISGKRRLRVFRRTRSLRWDSLVWSLNWVSKRAPGSRGTKQEILYCIYCVRLLSFSFSLCKYISLIPLKTSGIHRRDEKAATEWKKVEKYVTDNLEPGYTHTQPAHAHALTHTHQQNRHDCSPPRDGCRTLEFI